MQIETKKRNEVMDKKMNEETIRLAYSKFIRRNYKDYGLVPFNKIPKNFYEVKQ